MKVLLDVNVLVDICGKSPDVAESFKAVDVMLVRGDEPAMLVCMAPTVAAAAERHGMDIIVTRNTKDFKDSPVRAMHPRDFAEQLCPPDYGYEEISDL